MVVQEEEVVFLTVHTVLVLKEVMEEMVQV